MAMLVQDFDHYSSEEVAQIKSEMEIEKRAIATRSNWLSKHIDTPKHICFVYKGNCPYSKNIRPPTTAPWPYWEIDPYWDDRNIPFNAPECLYGKYEYTNFSTHTFVLKDYEHSEHVLFRYHWGPHEDIKTDERLLKYVDENLMVFKGRIERQFSMGGEKPIINGSYLIVPRDYTFKA